MEELVRLAKKQLRMQQVIIVCLVVVIVMFVGAGVAVAKYADEAVKYAGEAAGELETALGAVSDSINELDFDSLNAAIGDMGDLFGNLNELSDALDDVTGRVQNFGSWISGLFGN